MSRKSPITMGDQFVRVDQPEKIYVVTGLRTKPGFPPHAELQILGGAGPILIGVPALIDLGLYQRVR